MAEHEHQVFDVSRPGGRMKWIFAEFWTLILFGFLFLLMCALPLTLSHFMHNPFSSADTVWPAYGALLFAEFLAALAICFVAPAWLGPYMLLLAVYSLIAAEQGKAWQITGMPWGSGIALLFLMYLVAGLWVFWKAGLDEKKRRL